MWIPCKINIGDYIYKNNMKAFYYDYTILKIQIILQAGLIWLKANMTYVSYECKVLPIANFVYQEVIAVIFV